jgi:hypothetical protein
MRGLELFFEVFGGDLIEGTGGHPGAGYAQFFGPGQNFLVLQAEPF